MDFVLVLFAVDFGDNQLLSRLLMWWRNWRRKWAKWPWILVAVEAVETYWVQGAPAHVVDMQH